MKKIQKGFTLIELMIVVAAVAIPAYQDYIVKAKLAKVQSTMDSFKMALAMYFQENGSFPLTTVEADMWTSLGIPSTGPVMPAEVTALAVDGTPGTSVSIMLTLGGIKATSVNGKVMDIWGEAPSGATAMTWNCKAPGSGATTAGLDPIAVKFFDCTH
jgi:type IV pilus assembly protein PilA